MPSVAVALAASALAAGCYREAHRAPPPPPSNKASPPAIRSDDVLAFLPADADFVVGIDMRTLRGSEMFQHFADRLSESDSIKAKLAKASACGVDPIHALDRVTVAGHIGDHGKIDGVIVMRGVDGPRALDCAATYGAAAGTVTRDHDLVLVHGNEGIDEAVKLVNRGVVVIQFGPGVDGTKLAATLESDSPLRSSRAFMALFDRREPSAVVWGMVNGNSSALSAVRAMGLAPRSFDGAIVVAAELTAVVRVTFASPAEADQLVQLTSPSLASGKALFERLDVRTDGTSARYELAATEAQIEALWSMANVFLGGAFGGP